MNDRERDAFGRLLGVCRRLRGPDGCPWDREQTLTSMTPYLTEEAVESSQAAAAVGFDWPTHDGPLAKVREETDEIAAALGPDTDPGLAREIGDLLFATVNLARHVKVDPERELRAAMHRFRDRFHHIERRLAERGLRPAEATLEQMDALWNEAKREAESPPPPAATPKA